MIKTVIEKIVDNYIKNYSNAENDNSILYNRLLLEVFSKII